MVKMPEENVFEMEKFNETVLVRINPREATLPIDTSAEWSKGFMLTNVLIYELLKERWVEDFEDNNGDVHQRTHLHPQLLPLLKERRALMDQIYKISGNETVNEIKKEVGKLAAKAIFEGNKSKDIKSTYKDKAMEIIEAEFKVDINVEED